MSPPFCLPLATVGAMTDAAVFWFFNLDRDDDAQPKPPDPERRSPREHYATFLFHQGIHDPDRVARLWREHAAEHHPPREMG